MREAAAAVEEARDRVCEQRPAGHGSGDDFGLLDEIGRQQVDQVLREAPDRRRMPEQLMRVHVRAAVIPVAVIEVAVEHQDLGLLQVGQRFLTNVRASVHVAFSLA